MTHIKLGGEERPITYNNLALEEFQEMSGIEDFGQVGVLLQKNLKYVTNLAYVGLKHGFLEKNGYKGDLPFTRQDVGRWLQIGSSGDVFKAYEASMPKAEEGSQEVGEPKK